MTGTLTYDGQTVEVEGSGYHDHNWGNAPMNNVLSEWYWGRGEVGDIAVVFVTVWFSEAYNRTETHTLYLANGTEILGSFVNDDVSHL